MEGAARQRVVDQAEAEEKEVEGISFSVDSISNTRLLQESRFH